MNINCVPIVETNAWYWLFFSNGAYSGYLHVSISKQASEGCELELTTKTATCKNALRCPECFPASCHRLDVHFTAGTATVSPIPPSLNETSRACAARVGHLKESKLVHCGPSWIDSAMHCAYGIWCKYMFFGRVHICVYVCMINWNTYIYIYAHATIDVYQTNCS